MSPDDTYVESDQALRFVSNRRRQKPEWRLGAKPNIQQNRTLPNDDEPGGVYC